jgi:hypothetical protein
MQEQYPRRGDGSREAPNRSSATGNGSTLRALLRARA